MSKIKVLYCVDEAGDRQAPVTELHHDKIKEFDSIEDAQVFIDECTMVRNLDEIYEVVNTDVAASSEVEKVEEEL